jgi:fructokinase
VSADGWDEQMLELEAEYLALGLTNVIATLSPQRLILGGGVMKQPTLLPRIRTHVQRLAAGYFDVPEFGEQIAAYIVPPTLGDMAGALGALELARRALPA